MNGLCKGLTALALCLATQASAQGLIAASPVTDHSDTRTLLPAGTRIELVTTTSISSKKSVKGDLLYLKLATPVIVDGVIAIARDTIVVAQLVRAEKRGAFGRSGKLDVRLLYAELPSGTLRVSGSLEARGKTGADDAAATAVAFLALPFIATGRSAEIPAGTAVSARLDDDLWIDKR